jgi:hypothetical protein
MRDPPSGPFDRAMILGNSLNLLPSRDDVLRTLVATRDTLAPNGRLLLQLLNPASSANGQARLITKNETFDGQNVLLIKSMVPHAGRRFITLTSFAVSEGKRGDAPGKGDVPAWRSDTESAVLLDLHAEELKDLLGKAGLEERSWWGGMDGSPLRMDESTDLVVETERPV